MKHIPSIILLAIMLGYAAYAEARIRRQTITRYVSESEYNEYKRNQEKDTNIIMAFCAVIIGGALLIKLFEKK